MQNEALPIAEKGYSKTRISTSATTLVMAGTGVLKGISINKRPPGALTVYDTASATGAQASSSILGVFDSSSAVRVVELNARVTKGIVIAAAVTGGDYTVLYRAD